MIPTDVAPGCPQITQAFGCTTYEYEWYVPSSVCSTQRFHDGVDLAGPNCCGTPMLACGDGVVEAIGQTWPGSDGLGPGAILIKMTDGKYAGYGHGYNLVNVGDHVSKGQKIGTIGTQGNSTGCHLHLMIRTTLGTIPGGVENPLAYEGPGGGFLPMLSDAEQTELLNNTRSIVAWISGTGNATFYNSKAIEEWVAGTGNNTYYNTQYIMEGLNIEDPTKADNGS